MRNLVLYLCLIKMIILNAHAQDSSYLKQVEDNILLENWSKAFEQISKYSLGCETKSCEAQWTYTKAYFYHQKFLKTEQKHLADSAISFYQVLRESYPNHVQTNISLADAYLQKHQYEQALIVLKSVRDNHSRKEESYLLEMQLNSKIAEVLSKKQYPASTILKESALVKKNGYPDVAARVLANYISNNNNAASIFESDLIKVLLTYLHGLSDKPRNNISEVIVPNWNHPSVNELRLIINDYSKVDSLVWWKSSVKYDSLRPYIVMSEFLISFAKHEMRGNKNLKASAFLFKEGIKLITNDFNQDLIYSNTLPQEFFSISSDYGKFLSKYQEEVDPNQELFKNLEEFLFAGKGDAYANREGEKIAKFHKTLGLIYAERNQWKENGYKNATYQLKRAIAKSSDERNAAHLSKILARGRQSIGRADAKNWYAKSVNHFIETKNLRSAQLTLVELKQSGFADRAIINELNSTIRKQKGALVQVRGKVVDEDSNSLPGASVSIKGTSYGTVVNLDGEYQIDVLPIDTLVFTFIGCRKAEVAINSRRNIDQMLMSDLPHIKNFGVSSVAGSYNHNYAQIGGSIWLFGKLPLIDQNLNLLLSYKGKNGKILEGRVGGTQSQNEESIYFNLRSASIGYINFEIPPIAFDYENFTVSPGLGYQLDNIIFIRYVGVGYMRANFTENADNIGINNWSMSYNFEFRINKKLALGVDHTLSEIHFVKPYMTYRFGDIKLSTAYEKISTYENYGFGITIIF